MIRTFTMRLKATRRQDETLTRLLAQLCELYNIALEQRKSVWKSHRISISLYDQHKQLTELRNGVEEYQEKAANAWNTRAEDPRISTLAHQLSQEKERSAARDEREFIRGFGCAIATLVRAHDQPTVAGDIAKSNGLSWDSFRSADIDAFDLNPIRKALDICEKGLD